MKRLLPLFRKDPVSDRTLTVLDCVVGEHAGHFDIHVLRRADGSRTTACDEHLPWHLRPLGDRPAGMAPAGLPNPDAPAAPSAGVSVTRPIGPLCSGQSTSIDRGA